MSLFDRSKEVASSVGATARKQARRAQLELEMRRLRARIEREYANIGRLVYPSLVEGGPGSESPEMQVSLAELKMMQQQMEEKKGTLDALRHDEDEPGPDEAATPPEGFSDPPEATP